MGRAERFDKTVQDFMSVLPSLQDEQHSNNEEETVLPVQLESRQTPARKVKGEATKPSSSIPNNGKTIEDLKEEAGEALEQFYLSFDEEKGKALAVPPVAFEEPEKKEYKRDVMDDIPIIPGFITDYINCTRGMEVPTSMAFWGGMWTVSSALSRDASLKWYPKELWPNIYVMFVAPPALCRKSTGMDIGTGLLEKFPHLLPYSPDVFLKEQRFATSKTTAEGLSLSLKPEERVFIAKDGKKIQTAIRGSHITIAVSELPTFLGRQQYNTGLVSTLLDLYDCKDKDTERTRTRGKEELKNVYVTLIGGIAPDGMREAIPEEAYGGGFMSRVIVVNEEVPTKLYSMPQALEGYPVPADLVRPLAWIAHNARGQYSLTKSAFNAYDSWYHSWKEELFSSKMQNAESFRIDSIILKTALLLRAQEYRLGLTIDKKHIESAIQLVTFTFNRAKSVLRENACNGSEYGRFMNLVRTYIRTRGTVNRRKLLTGLSYSGIRSSDLDEIITQLAQTGFLAIRLSGVNKLMASSNAKEEYTYSGIGEGDEE